MPREEQNDFLRNLLNQAKTEDIDCLFRDSCDSDCLYDQIIDLLARDLEQSIFRSKIRNRDCTDNVEYNIVLNTTFYEGLIDRLKYRFPKATINVLPKPTIFVRESSLSRKGDTQYKKIMDWLSSKGSDYRFTKKELAKDIGLNSSQLKYVIRGNADLKQLFAKMKVKGKNEYITL